MHVLTLIFLCVVVFDVFCCPSSVFWSRVGLLDFEILEPELRHLLPAKHFVGRATNRTNVVVVGGGQ